MRLAGGTLWISAMPCARRHVRTRLDTVAGWTAAVQAGFGRGGPMIVRRVDRHFPERTW